MLLSAITQQHIAIAVLLGVALAVVASRSWRACYALDAAAIVFYAARPGAQTLALIAAQAVLRYVPELARQWALMLRLQDPQGWTLAFILFLLPGLRAYGVARPSTPAPAMDKTVALPATGATRKLSTSEWLDTLNNKPDEIPHLFIEGGSGAGKTWFAHAVLSARPGPVAAFGVKDDDIWSDGYVYRSDERTDALAQLQAEIQRRIDDDDRSGLTVVLDDFTRLAEHPIAAWIFRTLADIGRTLRLRLILIARGRLVKGLGSQGESDLREHFVFVRMSREHGAVLEMDDQVFALDTRDVRRLALPLPAERWYIPPKAGAVPVPVPQVAPDPAVLGTGTGNGTGTEDDELIEKLSILISAKVTRDQAHQIYSFRDEKWTKAGELLRSRVGTAGNGAN